jgi:DNA-binding transcriptional LysR family regulator
LAHTGVRVPADLGGVPVLSLDLRCAWWERFLQALPRTKRPAFSWVLSLNHLRGMISAACEGLGVALVPRYSVARELATGCLTELFGGLSFPEDRFCIYQKSSWAKREKNHRLAEFLRRLSMEEFDGAIDPVG